MIDDKLQDDTAMSDVSYFPHNFRLFSMKLGLDDSDVVKEIFSFLTS